MRGYSIVAERRQAAMFAGAYSQVITYVGSGSAVVRVSNEDINQNLFGASEASTDCTDCRSAVYGGHGVLLLPATMVLRVNGHTLLINCSCSHVQHFVT